MGATQPDNMRLRFRGRRKSRLFLTLRCFFHVRARTERRRWETRGPQELSLEEVSRGPFGDLLRQSSFSIVPAPRFFVSSESPPSPNRTPPVCSRSDDDCDGLGRLARLPRIPCGGLFRRIPTSNPRGG